MHHGQTACLKPGVPKTWEHAHMWSSDWDDVDCPQCLTARLKVKRTDKRTLTLYDKATAALMASVPPMPKFKKKAPKPKSMKILRPKDKPPVQTFEDIEMDVSLDEDSGSSYMVHIEAKAVWSHLESPQSRGFPSMKKLAEAMADGIVAILPTEAEVEFVVVKRVRGEFAARRGQKES